MTLALAWIRKIADCEELLFAADSRLGGGLRWDQCPKILTLTRSDAAVCFAGDTGYAYPLMLQLDNAIASHMRSAQRAMDLHDLRGHVLNVMTSLANSIYEPSSPLDAETEFLFGGYSWVRKAFGLWKFRYNPKEKAFRYEPAKRFMSRFGQIVFAGDWQNTAQQRLRSLMEERYGRGGQEATTDGFGLEPFEVLRDLLREKLTDSDGTIGGPPQVVKVYQHMNCRPVAVYWPRRESGSPTVLGRTLLDYENVDYWALDPDTLTTSKIEHYTDVPATDEQACSNAQEVAAAEDQATPGV